MKKTFILSISVAMLLASCKWASQEFSTPQMQAGEENFCVQVITPDYACNIFGTTDSAVNNLPLLGKTHRMQFLGDSAAEGYAILIPFPYGEVSKSGKDEIKYYLNRRLFAQKRKCYRLRNVKQNDHELTFDVSYGKHKLERVRILADFRGMKPMMETLSTMPDNVYGRFMQLALINVRPNGCECGGKDLHKLLCHWFNTQPDALPYVKHFPNHIFFNSNCRHEADFLGDTKYYWEMNAKHGNLISLPNTSYRFADTAVVVRDSLIIPIDFLTPRQKQLLAKEINAQNNAIAEDDEDNYIDYDEEAAEDSATWDDASILP